MSSPACPECQGKNHIVGTSLFSKLKINVVKINVEATAFTCRNCGCEFKASRTVESSNWVVVPHLFKVKKKRILANVKSHNEG